MANLRPIYNKEGKLISYFIRVHKGKDSEGKNLKPFTTTFKVEPQWTEKSALKRAETFAAQFEKECKDGQIVDERQTFEKYSEYVINTKEAAGLKHSTICDYRDKAKDVYPIIGYMKLKDIRPEHLNKMYQQLMKTGSKKPARAKCKADLESIMKEKKISREKLSRLSGVAATTIKSVSCGNNVYKESCKKIAEALDMKYSNLFEDVEDKQLSSVSVLNYHKFVSVIFGQAFKEGLINIPPTARVTLPKEKHVEPQYFQPEEVLAIKEAADKEPIMLKTILNLFMITGCRRGEILGLKWSEVDFEERTITIKNTVLYRPDCGVYVDTPKTERSKRTISVPDYIVSLLKEYKNWQNSERLRLKGYYKYNGFLFTKDDGTPIHPDTIGTWFDAFSKRNNLPHICSKAFRHTAASLLYSANCDPVTISRRLGHSQVSTTQDIYSHLIQKAERESADLLGQILMKNA